MMTLNELKEHCEKTINPIGKIAFDDKSKIYQEHKMILDLIKEHENRAKHDSELLDKVAESITEIYKCNLYCAEDYCDKEQCQNVEDCFYGAIVKAIERMKAEVNQ